MGYLHEGHGSLIEAARRENDIVIVTIFVNPLQFAAHEDLSTYPRNFKRDVEIISAMGGGDCLCADSQGDVSCGL